MANWQVMVQRQQVARDREGKKLGQLLIVTLNILNYG